MENNVDYKYFEATHSGHGLQNDDKIYKEYMETVEEYLYMYIPVEKQLRRSRDEKAVKDNRNIYCIIYCTVSHNIIYTNDTQ